jgi:hypothetical protein
MTTITGTPLELSATSLDELFASSPAGEIPTGRGRGTVVVYPGSRATGPIAAVTRVLLWQGKVFRPESKDLKNLLTPFSLRGLRAKVYTTESQYDGKPCIVLDYSTTSRAARRVRDEIRQIGPNEYLGVVFLGPRQLGVYFVLQF